MTQPDASRNRRNLPRVSHACQRCRAKKAKCNQQQPCLSCIKHSADCEYGVRRRGGRKKEQPLRNITGGQSPLLHAAFTPASSSRPEERDLAGQAQETILSGTHEVATFICLNQRY